MSHTEARPFSLVVESAQEWTQSTTESKGGIIEFHDALKNYGDNKKIGPVNLTIKKGEIMGFLVQRVR